MSTRRATTLAGAGVFLVSFAVAPPPASAAFPGVNGKIAFVTSRDGDYEVYTMNADGSNQTNLTNSSAFDWSPQWSPDGTRIAFVTGRDGNMEIYVMNADGSSLANLTNDPGRDTAPAWSPDGTRIAFTTDRGSSSKAIHVMNADGSNPTFVTAVGDRGAGDDLTWSPDGARIAFSDLGGSIFGPSSSDILVINSDGTGRRRLTHTDRDEIHPDWSPDGQQITFVVVGPFSYSFNPPSVQGYTNVYVMNSDGSGVTALTDRDDDTQYLPAWSPDGDKIAFMTDREDDPEVYTMSADGSDPVNLTRRSGWDGYASWQPLADRDDDGIADTPPPAAADQCRNEGWQSFNNPTFRNQGECVRHVVTQGPPRP